MSVLIAPDEVPNWVPGRLLLSSDGLGWGPVALRSYHYEAQEIVAPAMRDHLLVGYRRGSTFMQRRFAGRWRQETVYPGAASLLTRAQRVQWNWAQPIDVLHLYLSPGLVAQVASEVMDCVVTDVTLDDVLRTDDPFLNTIMDAMAAEAGQQTLGGPLFVDSLARALIVHLLRLYASVESKRAAPADGLSPAQARRIRDFIEANLGEPLDLAGMAAQVGMTPCLFARRFRQSFGAPPYAHVVGRRIERAKHLLAATALPIKEIAVCCGFTDQAHLTRLFARALGTTPAAFRKVSAG